MLGTENKLNTPVLTKPQMQEKPGCIVWNKTRTTDEISFEVPFESIMTAKQLHRSF